MTIRSFFATHDLVAVSASARETAINTEQTLSTSMLVALGDVINLVPRRESNAMEAIGKEEPDTVYDLGALAQATFNFEKAQPQHFAFLLAYALGTISTAAAGTGYQHTITPMAGHLDASRSLPSFTAGMRYGLTVLKRRFASCFVDTLRATFAADSWARVSADIRGTGKVDDNVYEETLSALDNATSLTLAANAVEGADADTRLQNMQRIRIDLGTGRWTEVAYSAVSAATPAVVTITSAGGAGVSRSYRLLYIPTEPAWCTFPARVSETPLRISELTLKVGGGWTGTAWDGGRSLSAELRSIEWSLNNNTEVQFVPGAGGTYATRAIRNGREQRLTVNREFREYILQQHIDANDTLGVYILCEGPVYDSPHKYQVELIFPKVAVMGAPVSVDGKRLAEAGDLIVLEDDTYGSVIAKVKNLVAAYAA